MYILKHILLCFVVSYSRAAADTGWFWHVTDFHYDFSYWTSQLSCNGVGPKNPGTFGDQWCDSPWRLIEETISRMKTTKSDVDFLLWTGDNVAHISDSHLSTQLNEELTRNITESIKSVFGNTPVYATFGNHDYYKSNLYPPHGNQIYNDTYLIWKPWINDQTQGAAFLKGGYYTTMASSNIRIVALNTNMYYSKDTVTQGLADPADQFAWLEGILTSAASNNEKVIITGHVPPGYTTPRAVRWMTPAFNNRLLDILYRHSDVITGMHFGHEHHDNFRILYNSTGIPVIALFIAPSVTPWQYRIAQESEPPHNPGVRLVKYDRQTGKQLDIVQYYIDLPASNAANAIIWKLGYNAMQMYGVPDISPTSMHEVTKKMDRFGGQAFGYYQNWYLTNAVSNPAALCDEKCHKVVMCGVRNLDDDNFNKCLKSQASCSTGSSACPLVG